MTTESDQYRCNICGEVFETPGHLGGHKNGHRQKIARSDLIAEIQRLFQVKGRNPTSMEMHREGKFSSSTVREKFGSWNDGLRAAGLTPKYHYEIPRRKLLEDIQTVAEEIGRTPTTADMVSEGQYSVRTAQSEFGSWNNALRAAGFEPNRIGRFSREDLLDEIRRLTDVLGHPPSTNDLKESGRYSVRGYFREFDGWHDAVSEAGFEPHGWVSVKRIRAGTAAEPASTMDQTGMNSVSVQYVGTTSSVKHQGAISLVNHMWRDLVMIFMFTILFHWRASNNPAGRSLSSKPINSAIL